MSFGLVKMNDLSSDKNRLSPSAAKLTPLLLTLLVMGGCATITGVDPDTQPHAIQSRDFVPADNGQWPAAVWWQDLHDPQLDTLIGLALKDSPDIAVAEARVRQAAAAARNVSANTGAKLDANGSLSRTRYSANSFYPPPIGGSTRDDGELSLNFSYDFDFWGKNRKALAAALGRDAASRAEAAGAAASLSTAVASSYYQWQVLNQRIVVQERIARAQTHLLEIETKRMAAGLSSGSDVAPLRANAAQPVQTLVQLKSEREQVLAQLKSLVASPDFPTLTTSPLPVIKDGLPSNLPLDLVSRRADITAARDRVQASVSDVDSAKAAFYPDVNLSASVGLSSLAMGRLFDASSKQAGVTPAIHLPIFDAGRLRAGLESRRADVDLAVAQYNQSIQNAINDINHAALQAQGAYDEAEPLAHQIQARQHDIDNTRQQLKAGLADGRALSSRELQKALLDDQEITRQGRALQAHVDLIKALGGGYRDDAAATTAQRHQRMTTGILTH